MVPLGRIAKLSAKGSSGSSGTRIRTRPAGPLSLSPFAFLPGSFCLRLSLFSFNSVSLFCFSALLSPFSSVSLSNSFLSLFPLSVSVFLFLPSLTLSATVSLSYFLLRSLLFALQLFSFLSLTFSSFLLWFHFPWFFPSLVFLPFLRLLLSVLLLLSSPSVALPKVFLPLLLIKDLDSGFSVTQESATEGFG